MSCALQSAWRSGVGSCRYIWGSSNKPHSNHCISKGSNAKPGPRTTNNLAWCQTYRSLNATVAQYKHCICSQYYYSAQKCNHYIRQCRQTYTARCLYCRIAIVVTFFISVEVLTPNGNFCVVPLLHSVSGITNCSTTQLVLQCRPMRPH